MKLSARPDRFDQHLAGPQHAARANTSQRIIDVIIGALADALPDAVVGAANGANTTAVFSGVDPATGKDYLYLETLGGGFKSQRP